MTRPVRIQFENALYHITSRGDRQEAVYEDDTDRLAFLKILGDVIGTYNWICHAYCLMSNHYHLVIQTPDANLSKGMRQLNGVYTQVSNRRHGRAGHLFQGRYKAILVDGDSYFLALNRYVVLNPVRAGMVAQPNDWPWSSYPAMIGDINSPKWLCTDSLLAQFSTEREEAVHRYARFVGAGIGEKSIWEGLNRQIYLGNEEFIKRVQSSHAGLSKTVGVPKTQKRPPAPSLEKLAARYANRDEGIVAAYATGEYSYQQIAEFYALHFTTVGKIVRGRRTTE
uniref:REP element-mobilizing transposase RayT n=1 Tax=Candidatus Kentrum sp. DK TaxID=2126562 RepID=A0A450TAE9_9GAMM|nr:MAG: REP element-mobilizing transposase RayT [Candidatus Kentron sp. DK]